ncbi:hypothetical protein F8388_009651 [Cannabis sativa]|uniref:t-SNARE coiled-coil homology domain-containing protein n=1 Tax=Cannabis sativa TaxID=3483 RepID=A0A7J6HAU5_CANSA|nr:hypothetical protein F8388_009651 [Cannabis sativa]KAF4392374.1 hypothetical protein G4B88_005333 [Cannabis sativa]
MTVIDILFRVDSICKKYEKYDIEKQRDLNANGPEDPFARLYAAFERDIDAALLKSEVASVEKNRASAAALNAEVRRMKARLMEDIPKLRKLAQKKDVDSELLSVKGLSREDIEGRNDLVLALPERIEEIPDGTLNAAKQTGGWKTSGSHKNIKFDSSEGLDTLKNLAHDMSEELDNQVPLVDEIDTKVDKATSDIKNTNVRLKQTLNQVRSSHNFCIDIILLCIILGIVSYLYK